MYGGKDTDFIGNAYEKTRLLSYYVEEHNQQSTGFVGLMYIFC